MAWTRIAIYGVWNLGWSFPRELGNSPSLARAKINLGAVIIHAAAPPKIFKKINAVIINKIDDYKINEKGQIYYNRISCYIDIDTYILL